MAIAAQKDRKFFGLIHMALPEPFTPYHAYAMVQAALQIGALDAKGFKDKPPPATGCTSQRGICLPISPSLTSHSFPTFEPLAFTISSFCALNCERFLQVIHLRPWSLIWEAERCENVWCLSFYHSFDLKLLLLFSTAWDFVHSP